MTGKRFKIKLSDIGELIDCDNNTLLAVNSIANELIPLCDLLNELHKENLKLKSENNMLRATIGRNEAYIERLKHEGGWRL